jgi:hypothetical protein
LINQYGTIVNGTSQIRLELETGIEVIGTVAYDPTDETQLLFNVVSDTAPSNTVSAIHAVVDPHKNNVISLLYSTGDNYQVVAGTRYLILNDINSINNTDFAKAWSPNGVPLVANANDIIEYNGTKWSVVYDSQTHQGIDYVTNTNTGVQYKWNGEDWLKSYEGLYREATWRLVL